MVRGRSWSVDGEGVWMGGRGAGVWIVGEEVESVYGRRRGWNV